MFAFSMGYLPLLLLNSLLVILMFLMLRFDFLVDEVGAAVLTTLRDEYDIVLASKRLESSVGNRCSHGLAASRLSASFSTQSHNSLGIVSDNSNCSTTSGVEEFASKMSTDDSKKIPRLEIRARLVK